MFGLSMAQGGADVVQFSSLIRADMGAEPRPPGPMAPPARKLDNSNLRPAACAAGERLGRNLSSTPSAATSHGAPPYAGLACRPSCVRPAVEAATAGGGSRSAARRAKCDFPAGTSCGSGRTRAHDL